MKKDCFITTLFVASAALSSLASSAEKKTEKKTEKRTMVFVEPIAAQEQKTKTAELNIRFRVEAKDGFDLVFDAPWKLELEKIEGLEPSGRSFDKKDFSTDVPGFQLNTRTVDEYEKITILYRLTAFVCTSDKKRCFREVHENNFVSTTKTICGPQNPLGDPCGRKIAEPEPKGNLK